MYFGQVFGKLDCGGGCWGGEHTDACADTMAIPPGLLRCGTDILVSGKQSDLCIRRASCTLPPTLNK
jgi:hypothetical protein